MKLRLRSAGQRLALEVPPSCPLGELQRLIAAQTGVEAPVLSFNNKDPLIGSPDAPIGELGVRRGDLLWLLSPGMPAAAASAAEAAAGCAAKSAREDPQPLPKAAMPAAVHGAVSSGDPPEEMQLDAAPAQAGAGSGNQDGGDEGPALEPLPASQRVPGHLLRTLQHSLGQGAEPAHILLLAAHAAMLETGFRPSWAQRGDSGNVHAVPGDCWVSRSLCRIQYQLATGRGEGKAGGGQLPTCTLHFSGMGPGAVLAAAAQRHTRHLSLQAAAFVAPLPAAGGPDAAGGSHAGTPSAHLLPDGGLAIGGRLRLGAGGSRRLWTALKDGLAFPTLLAAYAEAGLPAPAGLLALPEELKRGVLAALGPADLAALACTCCELRHLAADDVLWRPLLEAEFPNAASHFTDQHRGSKWAFGACWRERRLREEALRRARSRAFAPAVPHIGARPPFYPLPQRPGQPHVTGGDYDRLPQFGPTGLLGGAAPGGPFLGGSRRQGRGGLAGFRMH